jgi:antitoxin ParD1/3/4
MCFTQQFSNTLPHEMAELVRSKEAAGEYVTESEIIRDGLHTLAARDRAVEAWLRDQVVPARPGIAGGPVSRTCGGPGARASYSEALGRPDRVTVCVRRGAGRSATYGRMASFRPNLPMLE